MNCPFCQEDYNLKENYIAKCCGCDDEERFISFSDWYYLLFKFKYLDSSSEVFQ